MRLFVTGAGGFIGRHVVACARSRGHAVRALLRPTTKGQPAEWSASGVEVARHDLCQAEGLAGLLQDVDCVVHLAASRSGDPTVQFETTVLGTDNLLQAMRRSRVADLVLASSLSVYDYLGVHEGSLIDEQSATAADPSQRDGYCQAKLAQEALAESHIESAGGACVILRPGAVYGSGAVWTPRLGVRLGASHWLVIGGAAALPLIYVEHCAEAFVRAAEVRLTGSLIIANLVDDDPPSQLTYFRELNRLGGVRRLKAIVVPWAAMQGLAVAASWVHSSVLGRRLHLPGLLVPAQLHARCKPLRYSNDAAKQVLGWSPRYKRADALRASIAAPAAAHRHYDIRDTCGREPSGSMDGRA